MLWLMERGWNDPAAVTSGPFDGTHTHYITSGSATIDSQDIEEMLHHITEHGYGRVGVYGGQLLVFMNTNDFQASGISAWRAGSTTAVTQRQSGTLYPPQSSLLS